jgi:hypothetical protein
MNIFDGKGRINTDIDLTTIPADRRAAYSALVAAQAACEQAESNERITDAKVANCVRVHDAAVARIPKQTHVALVKEALGLV